VVEGLEFERKNDVMEMARGPKSASAFVLNEDLIVSHIEMTGLKVKKVLSY
jgi:hypothetical protein